MGTTVTRVDGKSLPVYRGVGEIVFGLDDDYSATFSVETASLVHALGVLGFIVIDPSDMEEKR